MKPVRNNILIFFSYICLLYLPLISVSYICFLLLYLSLISFSYICPLFSCFLSVIVHDMKVSLATKMNRRVSLMGFSSKTTAIFVKAYSPGHWLSDCLFLRLDTMTCGAVIRPYYDESQFSKVTIITQLRGSIPAPLRNTYLTGNPTKWLSQLKKFHAQRSVPEKTAKPTDDVKDSGKPGDGENESLSSSKSSLKFYI